VNTSGELTLNARLQQALSRLKSLGSSQSARPALIATLAVTALLIGIRHLRLLEPLELGAFDQLMQLRPTLPQDPRLLIVEVTETDIMSLKTYPITDAVMTQLLSKLDQAQPAAIGLDIYRDIPQPPGNDEFLKLLKKSDRIIPICKLSSADTPGNPPPPGLPDDRVGFADLTPDDNGIVRRALLFAPPPKESRCKSDTSISFQLARKYLEKKGVKLDLVQEKRFKIGKNFKPEWKEQELLKLGNVILPPIENNSGGYQNAQSGGYQILLNYRNKSLSRSVTVSDILNNRVDPSWIKDRIVLIGGTAPSLNDSFYTPYSSGLRGSQRMPGVEVHGQIVSQLISTAIDGRPQFWFWQEWSEILWVGFWVFSGSILVRVIRHPGQLVLAEIGAGVMLLGSTFVIFLGSGWIPVVAPFLGLIGGATSVIAFSVYETKKEADFIASKVKQQEENIALLQVLLKEKTPYRPDSDLESDLEYDDDTAIASEDDDDDDDTAIASEDDDEETEMAPRDDDRSNAPISEIKKKDRTAAKLLSGRYEIIRSLSSGGFGVTFLAKDIQRPGAPQCVVKQLKPARRDETFMDIAKRLFQTEAEILEKLGSHPQIPQLLAHFVERQEFYLVQEYVDGHPITDDLPVDKRLPEAQVVKLLKDVLEVLSYLHEHKVIHRDIKPGNIMRRHHDDKVVLIDFGAVKQIQPQEHSNKEGSTVAIGTRGYAPAEQYQGHPNFSSDIYALGMIAIQALTGIAPYQLKTSEETGDTIWRDLANVSDEVGKIVDKMVRYHFPVRYQTASAVLEDLRKL
jgi:CHASE2 domain-containing sensor protein/predicted Ser/Thr protein kinase